MPRIPRRPGIGSAALLVACLASLPAPAADLQRGRGLYELRCGGCHSESVHGRAHRVARDHAEVRAWVARWSEHLRLGWGGEEIEDVAAWLDATYYHFPCDTPSCRAVSLATAAGPR